jgi:hypothetical protein
LSGINEADWSEMHAKSPILWASALLAVLAAGVAFSNPEPPSVTAQVLNADLAYQIRTADEAYLVLLDRRLISNVTDWRERYSGQILGFGVRTARQSVSPADVEAMKSLLLNPTSWIGQEKLCVTAGDAALMMRGPKGEVTIMFAFVGSDCIRISGLACGLQGPGQDETVAREEPVRDAAVTDRFQGVTHERH